MRKPGWSRIYGGKNPDLSMYHYGSLLPGNRGIEQREFAILCKEMFPVKHGKRYGG